MATLVATMTLVPAFAWRVGKVHADYPGMTIFWKPNAAHLDQQSDHNPDSRNIGHAVDYMTYGDETQAAAVLAWHAADRTDQQYVIHNRIIYRRAVGFAPAPYTGTDPHTDHIHVSYRHDTPGVGGNALTGTGYYAAAESHQAIGSPLDPTGDNDMATIDSISPDAAKAIGEATARALVNQVLGHGPTTVGMVLQSQISQLGDMRADLDVIATNTAPAPETPPVAL